MTEQFKVVGKPLPQLDGVERITGRGVFTTDLELDGMIYGAILRSPHAHAVIRRIDTSAAEAMPGVRAILTADQAGPKYIHTGPKYADRYVLARGKVRFIGEEVAAVAADRPEQAEAAARAIRVAYEVLPSALDPASATATGAPEIHKLAGRATNLAQHTEADWGGVDAGFAKAAHVVTGRYTNPIVAPICMETNAVVARYDADTHRMDIWAGTQAPFFVRKEIAHVLDLPVENVRAHSIMIGGGFGGKSQATEPVAIAAHLARMAGRPVKIVLSRREEFIAGKVDHAKDMTVRTGVDENGAMLARHTDFVIENGAFTHMGIAYVSAVRQRTANLYRTESAGFKGELVYTNKVPGGSYRGMGAPHIIWAIESQIDELAERLGKDRVAYRLELANRSGDVTPQGFRISTCGMAECIRRVAEEIGWEEKKTNRRPWHGIGFSAMINPSVGILYPEGNFANIALELGGDGGFALCTQTADCGTWQNTALAQLAAEPLGLDIRRIGVIHMDTARAPDDLGSAASRVTFMSGQAALDAGTKMKAVVAAKLSRLWNVASDEIAFDDDHVGLPGVAKRWLGWPEIAELVGAVSVEGSHELNLDRADPETGYGHYAATYGFGAQAAEVEVDPGTGEVRVLRVVNAIDIGRVINPLALEGQMAGGIVQGIAMALSEELVFHEGQPVNTSLTNYRVPRAVEAPDITSIFVETADLLGPLGAKAGGEHSTNAAVGAVANAVADAIGVHLRDLPLTPHKVRAAIARKQGTEAELQPWRRPMNAEVAAVRAAYPDNLYPAMKRLGAKIGRKRTPPRDYSIVMPDSVADTVRLLRATGPSAKILAGGTDVFVGIKQGIYAPGVLVDISGLAELSGIVIGEGEIVIGASTTLYEVATHGGLRRAVPMLAEGLSLIATRQIQNVATIAGDLCQEKRCWFFRSALPCYKNGGASCPCYAITGDNRHHAILGAKRCAAPCIADAAPMLVSLGAVVRIVGDGVDRRVPMSKLYRWSGETVVRFGELIHSIIIPRVAGQTGAYEKFAHFRGDFPEASAAVSIAWGPRGARDVKISVAGVAPLPERLGASERHLLARGFGAASIRAAAEKSVFGALPLKDNAAKCDMLIAVVERSIQRAAERDVTC